MCVCAQWPRKNELLMVVFGILIFPLWFPGLYQSRLSYFCVKTKPSLVSSPAAEGERLRVLYICLKQFSNNWTYCNEIFRNESLNFSLHLFTCWIYLSSRWLPQLINNKHKNIYNLVRFEATELKFGMLVAESRPQQIF